MVSGLLRKVRKRACAYVPGRNHRTDPDRCLLTVLTFVIERFLTFSKATGSGNIAEFIRKVQYHLANKNVDSAIAECDSQKGSVGNVMKAGLRKYKEMITTGELDTEQKVLAIQKEVEEATALELPMLEKNLVFLSTIASVATLMGLLGTVMGMIRSFSALGDSGGGEAAQSCPRVFLKPFTIRRSVSVLLRSPSLCTMYSLPRSTVLLTESMKADLP